MAISEKAIQAIKDNRTKIEAELMLAFDKSNMTIKRWVDNKSIMLTTPLAMKILKRETGLTEKELLN